MSPAESVEQRLRDMEQAMWGIKGENGLTQQLRGMRDDISAWRKEETNKRESAQRAIFIALIAATVSLIGVVSTLIAVVSAQ
jgi:hypothetical protein